MDTYSFLRQLADSWVLLALFAFFIGAVIFAFRPGSRSLQAEAADLPFRHEDAPKTGQRPAVSLSRDDRSSHGENA